MDWMGMGITDRSSPSSCTLILPCSLSFGKVGDNWLVFGIDLVFGFCPRF